MREMLNDTLKLQLDIETIKMKLENQDKNIELVFFYLGIFHDKLIYFQQGKTRIAGRIIKRNNPPNQQSGKLSTFS